MALLPRLPSITIASLYGNTCQIIPSILACQLPWGWGPGAGPGTEPQFWGCGLCTRLGIRIVYSPLSSVAPTWEMGTGFCRRPSAASHVMCQIHCE